MIVVEEQYHDVSRRHISNLRLGEETLVRRRSGIFGFLHQATGHGDSNQSAIGVVSRHPQDPLLCKRHRLTRVRRTKEDQRKAVADWKADIKGIVASPEQLEAFFNEVKHVHDLVDWIQTLENLVKREGRDSKSLKVAKWALPLFKTMNMIAPVIFDNAPVDKNISGPILGAITQLLSVTKKATDFQEGVEKTLEDMITKLGFLNDFEDIFPKDLKVRRGLIAVYSIILTFAVEASRFFVNKKGSKAAPVLKFLYPTWKEFKEPYDGLLVKFDRRVGDLRDIVNASHLREMRRLALEERAFMIRQADQFTITTAIDSKVTGIKQQLDEQENDQRLERLMARFKEISDFASEADAVSRR